MATDLIKWLRTQLDEDERIAREAGEDNGVGAAWSVPCWVEQARDEGDDIDYGHNPCHCCRIEGDNITIYDEGGHDRSQAVHIARWDPDRVLAEVETKRVVVEVLVRCTDRKWTGTYAVREEARLALGALALVYADRPGYQPEWAVSTGERP